MPEVLHWLARHLKSFGCSVVGHNNVRHAGASAADGVKLASELLYGFLYWPAIVHAAYQATQAAKRLVCCLRLAAG